MNQIEKLHYMSTSWGVGRTCLNCKHVQYRGEGVGLPISGDGQHGIGWDCQKCGTYHQEPTVASMNEYN